jgi:alginate production protein
MPLLIACICGQLATSCASRADSDPYRREALPAVDFDAPPRTDIELLPDLRFGARLELEYDREQNFDLDGGDPDDLSVWEPTLSTAFLYTPIERLAFFTDLELSHTVVDDDEDERDDETSLSVKQLWLSLDGMLGDGTLKLGRQRFNDKREWIYDEELDGGRILYPVSKYLLDLSVSERHDSDVLLHEDEDRVTNYIAQLHYLPDEDNGYGFYVFAQNDRKASQEEPVFIGVHAHGELIDDLEYWLELAHVRGDNGPSRIRAVGFDLGATYELDLPFEPALTLGYAFGSGDDDPSDGTDGNFRQTGLQNNQAKFDGVIRVKYYGEMLDPELSNLGITTVGFGLRPIHDISIDVVHHHYRQIEASTTIRDAEIDEDPDGIHNDLGHEIDFVAGYRFKPHHKGSVVVGYFFPGEAFPRGADGALFTEVQLRYDF